MSLHPLSIQLVEAEEEYSVVYYALDDGRVGMGGILFGLVVVRPQRARSPLDVA